VAPNAIDMFAALK